MGRHLTQVSILRTLPRITLVFALLADPGCFCALASSKRVVGPEAATTRSHCAHTSHAAFAPFAKSSSPSSPPTCPHCRATCVVLAAIKTASPVIATPTIATELTEILAAEPADPIFKAPLPRGDLSPPSRSPDILSLNCTLLI